MKAYSGKKRIAKKLNRNYFKYPELTDYLLKIKPGDLIHACTGYNHVVRDISFEYLSTGNRKEYYNFDSGICYCGRGSQNSKTRVISYIQVTDTDGMWHLHDFVGGCIDLPRTKGQIEDYIMSWDCPERWETIKKWKFDDLAKRIELLKSGIEVVSNEGLKLPL